MDGGGPFTVDAGGGTDFGKRQGIYNACQKLGVLSYRFIYYSILAAFIIGNIKD